MALKENLNKIHFSLSNRFDVELNEKSDIKSGNYIEILIKEDKKELRASIKKADLESSIFNWSYLSNPENSEKLDACSLYDNKFTVNRVSNVDGFLNDVVDIFEKNRFDSDYLEKIK